MMAPFLFSHDLLLVAVFMSFASKELLGVALPPKENMDFGLIDIAKVIAEEREKAMDELKNEIKKELNELKKQMDEVKAHIKKELLANKEGAESCTQSAQLDLQLVVDTSGSVGEQHFNQMMKDIAEKVLASFVIGPKKTQVALFKYSDQMVNEFDLDKFPDMKSLKNATKAVKFIGGGTNTGQGMEEALGHFIKKMRKDAKTAKVCIVFTDGETSDASIVPNVTTKWADAGVTVFAVGIGTGISKEGLVAIAGNETRALQVDDFSELANFTNTLLVKVCETIPMPNPKECPCLMGPSGPKGEPGVPGAPGQTGPKGNNGPIGPKGEHGSTGPEGSPGANGKKGSTGETGATGPKGSPGQAGLKGDRGSIGPKVIRLSGSGSSHNHGRVEVFHNGQWGTVCNDHFDSNTNGANVVCRMLGFTSGTLSINNGLVHGPGSGQIWLDDVRCSGTESSIVDCSHRSWGAHNCGHGEDIGVECS